MISPAPESADGTGDLAAAARPVDVESGCLGAENSYDALVVDDVLLTQLLAVALRARPCRGARRKQRAGRAGDDNKDSRTQSVLLSCREWGPQRLDRRRAWRRNLARNSGERFEILAEGQIPPGHAGDGIGGKSGLGGKLTDRHAEIERGAEGADQLVAYPEFRERHLEVLLGNAGDDRQLAGKVDVAIDPHGHLAMILPECCYRASRT